VFVADVMDAKLTNREVFTQRHAHDAKVASAQHTRTNGIPSSFNNLYQFLVKVLFWSLGFKIAIYL
jgi:hypothetical protein